MMPEPEVVALTFRPTIVTRAPCEGSPPVQNWRMSTHLAVHYTLKHRIIATVSHWFDGYTYTVRHGLLRGMKRKGGLGFLPIGTTETAESRFFRQLHLSGRIVYDIGGFEGLVTLFFSARAETVVVYEPNPQSRSRLVDNLRLNGVKNVTVRPVGVGAASGAISIIFDPLMPGAATAHASIGSQIRETACRTRTADIRIVRLDDDIREQGLPAPEFVKIDVEGLELAVLQGMAETLATVRPDLYIEMHGATLDEKIGNAHAVVELLDSAGYRMQHVESGSTVSPKNAALAATGHLTGAHQASVASV
jgi:FkbM family methyltransferase